MTLFLAAAPVGLATGLLAWMVAGGAKAGLEKLEPVAAQIGALPVPRANPSSEPYVSIADLVASPIFALSNGPGAMSDPIVRLDGLSVSAKRTAALVSINGAPSEWLRVGDSRSGVTIQQVRVDKVVVDTELGPREVALGQRLGGETAQTVNPATGTDPAASGYRSPPAPASAPVSQ